MPTISFSITDEDVERIASRVADNLADLTSKRQPASQRQPPDDRLQVNRVEAARLLGCSPKSVDRLRSRGLLHPNRATRCPMYSIKELERFVRECSEPI
jgi:hypothetical protein